MRIHLPHPHFSSHRREMGVFLLAFTALGFWASSGKWSGLSVAPFSPSITSSRAANVVPAENPWRELSVAQRVPDVLAEATLPELRFQNQQIPVATFDGNVFNNRLPETLLLKLDQPGNAFLIAETDGGTFVKALEDATPGFASLCRLDARAFGTVQGEAIYFDRDELYLKRLWIVQDATAQSGRVPGWVQVPQNASGLSLK
jgi:hypothetical protein